MSDYRVFVPFVNRPDLLHKAVESLDDVKDYLTVIDNSVIDQEYPWENLNSQTFRPKVPYTFSQTMNLILKMTREANAKICVFMHSDAEAGPGTVMALISQARKLMVEGKKWGVLFTNYDALAAFNVDAFEDIGGWDTVLTQYYSDNDSYRRLKLNGWECIDTGLPVKHEPSQTIKSDPKLNFINGVTFPLYGFYYEQKHGGPPGKEKFDRPFNGALDR